jgi:hypothetical protein
MWLFSLFSTPRSADAEYELRAELKDFAYDGLVQLELDLKAGVVKRGTWDGCVLSYRRGAPGSVNCDRRGRRGNAFTRYWDTERISNTIVCKIVQDELAARTKPGVVSEPLVPALA